MIYDQLAKKQNETDFEHHIRIIEGKLGDKTLSDYDYSELSKYAYGKEYSTDCARRMFYGSKRTLDYLNDSRVSAISDHNLLSELDSKMVELRKERQKFYDQRREYNSLIRQESREEYLYHSLGEAANRLDETVGCLFHEDEQPIEQINNRAEAILVLCDWHYGMVTDNIFNTYNTEICKERVKNTIAFTIEKLHLHQCNKLHVVVLGDLFHGAIHTSARVASEELVCDQLMQVSEILAQSICELSRHVPEIMVHTTYGNHGRTVQNKNDNIHRDNMERIIPWWLKQRLKMCSGINFTDDTGNEFIYINALGHGIIASHGDLDSLKSSPKILSTLFQKKYNTDIEFIILADKHHRESFEELGITSEICGSLCGTDDYANGKRLYSTPSQLMLVISPEYGVEAEYRIKCQ